MSNNALVCETRCEMSGEYEIIKQKKSTGDITFQSAFPNLITDLGLNLAGGSVVMSYDSAWGKYISVGNNNATPTTADTQLGGFLYQYTVPNSQSLYTTTTYVAADGPTPAHYVIRVTGVFEPNSSGIWQEVGIGSGTNGTNLFSRALIRDSNGDPFALTVLSDEYVTVIYTLRLYLLQNPTVNAIMNGADSTEYTFASYPRLGTTSNTSGMTWQTLFGVYRSDLAAVTQMITYGGVSSIGAAWDSTVTGTQLSSVSSSTTGATGTRTAYVNGTHYTEWTFSATSTVLNSATAIEAIHSNISFSKLGITMTVSPPFVKDDTKTLAMTFRFSWGRYVA